MTAILLSQSVDHRSLQPHMQGQSIGAFLRRIFVEEGQDLLALVVAEAKNEPDWLDKLYVEPTEHLFDIDYVWEDIKQRKPTVSFGEPITDTARLLAHTNDGSKKGIFILGDIGCGKTTFLHHLRHAFLAGSGERICFLYDFGRFRNSIRKESDYEAMHAEYLESLLCYLDVLITPQLEPSYLFFLVEEVLQTVFTPYRRAQARGETLDLDQLRIDTDKWEKDNPRQAVDMHLRFLRKRGWNVLLLMDNVDPIPICYQERFAEDVMEFVHRADVQIVTAMRFYSLERVTTIAAGFRHHLVMKLDLPPLKAVIKRRLQYYILDRLSRHEYTIDWGDGTAHTVSTKRLVEILEYVSDELLSDDLIASFVCFSDMNTRFALENYMTLLDSPQISLTPDIVHQFYVARYAHGHVFNVKSYDVLIQALIGRGGGAVYQRDISKIENIYWTYSADRGAYYPELLKLYLLELIYRFAGARGGGQHVRRFVAKVDVVRRAEVLGWDRRSVEVALEEMFRRALLFGYESDVYEDNTRLALSNNGVAYRSMVARMTYYIYFMLYDVPVDGMLVDKYFKVKSVGIGGERKYVLKDEWKRVGRDRVMHCLTGEFISELSRREMEMLREIGGRAGGREILQECFEGPLMRNVARSFRGHCETIRGQQLVEVLAVVEGACTALESAAEAIWGGGG